VPSPIDDVRQLIASRLADLDAEAKQLERVLSSLGSSSRRRPGRPRKHSDVAASAQTKRRGPRKGKRAARGQRREQLLTAVKANPGARPSELAKAIGVRPAQAHALVAKARAEKLIVKSGKGYALSGTASA
jgi:hypothetical protein